MGNQQSCHESSDISFNDLSTLSFGRWKATYWDSVKGCRAVDER